MTLQGPLVYDCLCTCNMQGINNAYIYTVKTWGWANTFNSNNNQNLTSFFMKTEAAIGRTEAKFSANTTVFSLPLNFLVMKKENKNHMSF